MSNKKFDQINPLDQLIRRTSRMGNQENGTYLTIEFIHGFELFNTRPYHNYETWSQGYRVTDPKLPHPIEREDLDDALVEWARQREELRNDLVHQ